MNDELPVELQFHEIHKKCVEVDKQNKNRFYAPCKPKQTIRDFPPGHFFDFKWNIVTCKKCLTYKDKK